jgi:hypothetical protein
MSNSKRVFLISLFFVAINLISPVTGFANPLSVDLGWGTPSVVSQKSGKARRNILVWPVQLSNNTPHRKSPVLEIVAVTNTGRQYSAPPLEKVTVVSLGEVPGIKGFNEGLFPQASLQGFAVFNDFDLNATRISFYVGGLFETSNGNPDSNKFVLITYERKGSGWEWIGTKLFE